MSFGLSPVHVKKIVKSFSMSDSQDFRIAFLYVAL